MSQTTFNHEKKEIVITCTFNEMKIIEIVDALKKANVNRFNYNITRCLHILTSRPLHTTTKEFFMDNRDLIEAKLFNN